MHEYTRLITDLIKGADSLYQRPRIDYYEFRDNWLPLFNSESNKELAPLGEWVQAVARGNAFMEVDVIKNGYKVADELYPGAETIEGGEYMFTIPAILNRDVDVTLAGDKLIDNELMKANKKREVMANSGERHFKSEIIDKLKVDTPVDPQLFEKMNSIFEHFGIARTSNAKPIAKKTEQSNITTEGTDGSLDNDLIDFGDF